MSGSTAELMTSAAARSQTKMPFGGGGALGTILVSNNASRFDATATLRFNCGTDDVVKLLVDRYGILGDVSQEAVSRRLELESEVMQRSTVLACLEEAEQYEADDPRVRHGRLFNAMCLLQPQAEKGLFTDEAKVVDRKLAALRDLLRMSKRTVVYTEAVTAEAPLGHYGEGQCGLSHAKDTKILPGETAPDCYTGLRRLAEAGLVHAWVQLGHDGLPQQAGFPGQVREVYDSWRDHHSQGYKAELTIVDAELAKADLILVLTFGSSFSGSTARIVSEVAGRLYAGGPSLGRCLGLAVLGQTTTGLDSLATLRLNQVPDMAVAGLVKRLGDIPMVKELSPIKFSESATEVAGVGCGAPARVARCSYASQDEKEEARDAAAERKQECHTPCPTPDTSHRAQVTDTLSGVPVIGDADPRRPHGRMLAHTCLEPPVEGRDREAIIDYKVRRLADLMQLSRKTLLYIDATTTNEDGFDPDLSLTYCEVQVRS